MSFEQIKTLNDLYNALVSTSAPEKEKAEIILHLICWNNSVLAFDPFSDKILSSDIDKFLLKINDLPSGSTRVIKDFLYHIINFTGYEIDYLMKNLREKILRQHENLPLYSIRETDSKCLQILARRPGRTVKEKLANHPFMVGVKRHYSTDTQENQLLKLFLVKLEELLLLRKETLEKCGLQFNDNATNLISKINFWKFDEAVVSIGRWKNNPPNNVLLQDRKYRKVWLGWSLLRNIDNSVCNFTKNIYSSVADYMFWKIASELRNCKGIRIFQKPITFNKIKNDKSNFDTSEFFTAFYILEDVNERIGARKKNNVLTFRKDTFSINVDFNKLCIKVEDLEYPFLINSKFINDLPKTVIQMLSVKQDISENDNNDILEENETVGLDLSCFNPKVYNGIKNIVFKHRIMCQKWIQKDDEKNVIDNSESFGIYLKDECKNFDIESYTFKSILTTQKDNNNDLKQKNIEAAINLSSILSKHLNAERAIYAVPDIINDFEIEPLRIGMNGAFNASIPLPVSVAAIEGALDDGSLNTIDTDDLIFVLDATFETISITPIKCTIEDKLKKESHDSQGVQLIRYPSIAMNVHIENDNLLCSANLKRKIYEYFDIDGVYSSLLGVSFYDDNFEHPKLANDCLNFNLELKLDLAKFESKIEFFLNKTFKKNKIYIISTKSFINLNEIKKSMKYECVECFNQVAKGVYIAGLIESELVDASLWFDYLPDLSMEAVVNGIKQPLDLVKNKKITPKLNVTVPIEINWKFTFPANKKFYHFPLVQGTGGKNHLNFEAYIESDKFPLDQPLDCSLELTYTYGAEKPYKLSFIPQRDIGIKKLDVQWMYKQDLPIDYDSLIIPPFPEPKDENFYRNWIGEKSSKPRDLLQIVLENIAIYQSLKPIEVDNVEIASLRNDRQWFIIHSKDKIYKYSVFAKEELPNEKKNKIINDIKKKFFSSARYQYTFKDLISKSIHMYALFNDGKRISDFNPSFRDNCQSFINYTSELLKSNNYDDSIIGECLYLSCTMTDDLPQNIIDKISDYDFMKNYEFFEKLISRTLHDCKKQWQKEILKRLTDKFSQYLEEIKPSYDGIAKKLNIIGSAIWRDKDFIYALNVKDVENLIKLNYCVFDYLVNIDAENDCEKFKNKNVSNAINRNKLNNRIAKSLELLLGLLRSRLLDDEAKSLLAPNTEYNDNYLKLINKLITKYSSKPTALKSRLKLEINKSIITEKAPDLLLAAKLFLESDDISNSITISGLDLDSDND